MTPRIITVPNCNNSSRKILYYIIVETAHFQIAFIMQVTFHLRTFVIRNITIHQQFNYLNLLYRVPHIYYKMYCGDYSIKLPSWENAEFYNKHLKLKSFLNRKSPTYDFYISQYFLQL